MSIRVLIGGDLVPAKSNHDYFIKQNTKHLIGTGLAKMLEFSDFTTFNLETPLVDKLTPIKKSGQNLITPTDTIEGLKNINPHFFTLANIIFLTKVLVD